MYTKHSKLIDPEPRQRLWRYIKYDRLLQLINDGNLYFPHITKMCDQWEGLLTDKTRDKLFWLEYAKYGLYEPANESVRTYEEFKNDFYVNSWHMASHESYLMWRVYGERECAIQTTFERINASLHNTQAEINGCVVKYIDYEREHFEIGNVFTPVSYKDIPYKDEREFRLLYWKVNLPNQDIPVDNNGVNVAVDLDILIENIYINPAIKLDIGQLTECIKSKSLSCETINSRIRESHDK